ncbi:hypothetical protein [Streptomyces sp. NPDC004685]
MTITASFLIGLANQADQANWAPDGGQECLIRRPAAGTSQRSHQFRGEPFLSLDRIVRVVNPPLLADLSEHARPRDDRPSAGSGSS